MTLNINRRLDRLEEELKCIMECRKTERVFEVLREKCDCCPCKRSSASSSPSRSTKRSLVCKSKSLHGPSRRHVCNYRPHCQKSKRNLFCGGVFKIKKCKCVPCKSISSSVSFSDSNIKILHDPKKKSKPPLKLSSYGPRQPTRGSRPKSPIGTIQPTIEPKSPPSGLKPQQNGTKQPVTFVNGTKPPATHTNEIILPETQPIKPPSIPTKPPNGAKVPSSPAGGIKRPDTPPIGTKLPSTPSNGAKLPNTPSNAAKLPIAPSNDAKFPSSDGKLPNTPSNGANLPSIPGRKLPSMPSTSTNKESPANILPTDNYGPYWSKSTREDSTITDHGELCNISHCVEIENVTKELKNELELMKTQILQLEESKGKHIRFKESNGEDKSSDLKGDTTSSGTPSSNTIRQERDSGTEIQFKNIGSGTEIRFKNVSSGTDMHYRNVASNTDIIKDNISASIVEKDDYIKSLTDTNQNLVNLLNEKDSELKALKEALKTQQKSCQSLTQALAELKDFVGVRNEQPSNLEGLLTEQIDKNKELQKELDCIKRSLKCKSKNMTKVNGVLENEIKDLQEKQCALLQKLSDCTYQNMSYQQEIQRLRNVLSQTDINLEKELEESKYRERQLLENLQILQDKILELEHMNLTIRRNSNLDIDELLTHNASLQEEYNALARKLQQYEAEELQRAKCVETELSFLKRTMSESEKTLLQEKSELRSLVADLTEVIKEQKARIEELNDLTRHQEELVKSQTTTLFTKDEQLEKSLAETNALKSQIASWQQKVDFLQEQLELLQNCQPVEVIEESDHTECQERIAQLVNELEETKCLFQEMKDSVLLKNTIIEDQANTIQVLRAKINERCEQITIGNEELKKAALEIKKLTEDLCKLQADLTKENHEKTALQNDIEKLQIHKEELKKKLAYLEEQIKKHGESQSTSNVENRESINKLQNALKAQQEEFEAEKQRLIQEKNCAVHAAKFATQKLMETVRDFQNQVDNQQKVQNMLTELLNEKDDKIRAVVEQMSSMTVELSCNANKKTSSECSANSSKKVIYECSCKGSSSGSSSNKQSSKTYSNECACKPTRAGYNNELNDNFMRQVKERYNNYNDAKKFDKTVVYPSSGKQKASSLNLESEPSVSRDVPKENWIDHESDSGSASNISYGNLREVVEAPIMKQSVKLPNIRNIYWPPIEDDVPSPGNYNPLEAGTTRKPVVEEVFTKKSVQPLTKRNIYWPPTDDEEDSQEENIKLEEVHETFQKTTYVPKLTKEKYWPGNNNL